ncbi:MAG: AraC family transcriptional regulator [Pseudomonadales bacterium]|nr:AraC family transcriptional regulator [Pseudomonadales bacterium]
MNHSDVLADVLSVGQVSNRVLAYKEMPTQFGMFFDLPNMASFQIISRGKAWARSSPDATPVALNEGDIVFFSNSSWHAISSHIDSPIQHFEDVKPLLKPIDSQHDSLYPDTVCVFCGCYELSSEMQHPFFSQLPSFIHIKAEQVAEDRKLQALIEILLREGNSNEMGTSAVIAKLVDILLIFIVRSWMRDNADIQQGWLAALGDPKIAEAIALMHKLPAQRWTVEKLASEVSMSRAAFAKKFSESTGESPGVYLTRWRIDLSAKLLRDSDLPLVEIANSVGYESDTAFSKVFKKQRGTPPGEYRNHCRADHQANLIQ